MNLERKNGGNMNKEINIKEVENGYQVAVKDTTRNGVYVFKSGEIFLMLETVGKWINGKPVKVKEN